MSSGILQDYLNELLSEPPVPAHTGRAQKPLQAAAEKPLQAAPDTPPIVESKTQLLDDNERRDQLQQLLYSARATVAQHAEPETAPKVVAPSVKTATAVAPSVKSDVPETNDLIADTASDTALTEHQSALDEALQWHENGRPVWAQEPFEVLLFTVSGLTLAVPLITLGQIQPLTDELTPLFGQADWFMGLQPTPSGKVRTINTAKFVMPERYDPSFVDTAQYVVSINGVPWGLAVDKVEQPMRLAPDDVKWRSSRSKRAWLAGTVKEHMCALLDIPMMGKLLTDADRNSRK
ncbi:chemotaxis protein CheW [Gilvimarinus polysaccharolyticus]|uniref:chemotaxis protein CheW n=1 Tax=Gilvimarinus polysaccharolyticus TaxID=863921 RepID=UPI0006734616|nr:chemotaxis protein CheW [Gilvimarinus polysaccharolyticus]